MAIGAVHDLETGSPDGLGPRAALLGGAGVRAPVRRGREGGAASPRGGETPAGGAGQVPGAVARTVVGGNAGAEVEPSDGRLVQAVLGGDGRAFELLVRRHDRRAFSLAFRLLGHREDAEDVVQESFVAALEALERFDVTRPFGPWFYRIVVNRSLNARKARSRRSTEAIPDDAPASTASPERAAEAAEARKTVFKALESLTERQRHVVEMIELEGLSGPEVAEVLGIPEGTVRWHLHSARKALRAALAGRRPAEGGSE